MIHTIFKFSNSLKMNTIETLQLFPILDNKLIELLCSLTHDEWKSPTIAKLWNVKDVAAHLLDGNLRTLSVSRDHHFSSPSNEINTFTDLVEYLNSLNKEWVSACKRLSPEVLIDLLEKTGKEFSSHLASLDLNASAVFPVSWAGHATSPNWFHIAREYTEKWHHQQQIRDAVYKPGIMTTELYYPVLETFMFALPYTYQNVSSPPLTSLKITITGEGGGDWFLIKKDNWELLKSSTENVHALITIDGKIAWKLFTKSWRKEQVIDHVKIEGDHSLAVKVLEMVAVMA